MYIKDIYKSAQATLACAIKTRIKEVYYQEFKKANSDRKNLEHLEHYYLQSDKKQSKQLFPTY